MTPEEKINEELKINLKIPISNDQILKWLMEKRAVDNPDCPPYNPKSGL